MRRLFWLTLLGFTFLLGGCASYSVKLHLTGRERAVRLGRFTTGADLWRGVYPTGVIFRDNTGTFGVLRGGLGLGGRAGLDEAFETSDGLTVRVLGEGTMVYEQDLSTQRTTGRLNPNEPRDLADSRK